MHRTGVPQIALPAWPDCFENATRAEWLGVGVFGNKKSAPGSSRAELREALLKVLGDKAYAEKAQALARRFCKTEGRKIACEKLVELAEAEDMGGEGKNREKGEDLQGKDESS